MSVGAPQRLQYAIYVSIALGSEMLSEQSLCHAASPLCVSSIL